MEGSYDTVDGTVDAILAFLEFLNHRFRLLYLPQRPWGEWAHIRRFHRTSRLTRHPQRATRTSDVCIRARQYWRSLR
jgi:hypothetical protein